MIVNGTVNNQYEFIMDEDDFTVQSGGVVEGKRKSLEMQIDMDVQLY